MFVLEGTCGYASLVGKYIGQIIREVIGLGLSRFYLIIILFVASAFVHIETVYSEQGYSFHRDFLIQRMMIAKIREFSGDITAKTLIKGLAEEAIKDGIEIPKWSYDKSLRISLKDLKNYEKEGSNKYDSLILEASGIYALSPALIKAVIKAESDFINDAISHKGAQGLCQLMPDTSKELGVINPFNPQSNIFGGAKLLKKHLEEFGSIKKTLIAYNAGPKWVRKRKGIPKETRIYIRRVISYYHKYKRDAGLYF
ncbi:lytic transglycosylase domain-containing protein [Thermodesulfobacteriota bacterium]